MGSSQLSDSKDVILLCPLAKVPCHSIHAVISDLAMLT